VQQAHTRSTHSALKRSRLLKINRIVSTHRLNQNGIVERSFSDAREMQQYCSRSQPPMPSWYLPISTPIAMHKTTDRAASNGSLE
jgi:hypothetical protein